MIACCPACRRAIISLDGGPPSQKLALALSRGTNRALETHPLHPCGCDDAGPWGDAHRCRDDLLLSPAERGGILQRSHDRPADGLPPLPAPSSYGGLSNWFGMLLPRLRSTAAAGAPRATRAGRHAIGPWLRYLERNKSDGPAASAALAGDVRVRLHAIASLRLADLILHRTQAACSEPLLQCTLEIR